MISSALAAKEKLNIGDTFTLGLGDTLLEQYAGVGAVAALPERYAPPVQNVTLEIVGIYSDLEKEVLQSNNLFRTYSSSTIFVPLSLLPASAEAIAQNPIKPGEFSFVVENAKDIRAFLAESAPLIEEMGLTLSFSDGGWLEIEDQFFLIEKVSLIAILALSMAMVAVITLIVFLFIAQRKNEYAIMRTTGCPKGRANAVLFIPLFLMTLIAVAVGSGLAWANVTLNMTRILSSGLMAQYHGTYKCIRSAEYRIRVHFG